MSSSYDAKAVERLIRAGSLDQAQSLVQSRLLSAGDDPAALFQYAKLQAARGNLQAAVETLDQPAIQNSEAALPALGQSAEWLVQLNQPRLAQQRYRQILKVAPQADIVHRKLAELLLRCGRPTPALPSLRHLCRSGNVKQSELAALIAPADAIEVPIIGAAAEARQLATKGFYLQAVNQLKPVIDQPETPADVTAFYLRLLAESQQFAELDRRLPHVQPAVLDDANFWSAVGIRALDAGDAELAAGTLLQSLILDSTATRSIQRLRQAFQMSAQPQWDERLKQRFRCNRDAIRHSNTIAKLTSDSSASQAEIATQMEQLAGLLNTMGRRLEAVLWRTMAAQGRGDSAAAAELRVAFGELAISDDAFPTADELRLGLPADVTGDPRELIANVSSLRRESPAADQLQQQSDPWPPISADASWVNVAGEVGLHHRYEVAHDRQRDGFAIYQTYGGGLAVLDFDRDGLSDLYFAQGGIDPPQFHAAGREGDCGNRLYAHWGQQLHDVTRSAGACSTGYTLGVSAGDWNQDGFDDLFVNRFGALEVMTNRGDGTFATEVVWRGSPTWVPTSVALADVNQDGFQDLVALGYADSEMVWLQPPRDSNGRPKQSIGPGNFAGAANQVVWGTQRGWQPAEPLGGSAVVPDRSLGMIIGPLTGRPEDRVNQIFVGNDQQNNRLWTWHPQQPSSWEDSAIIDGCAFGNFGAATAAMGITASDLNQDGALDLHITNYQNEPVSLYEAIGDGLRDQTVRRGLLRSTVGVLGFGCQGVDYDLNGVPDLVVTNGHIDDATETDEPFAQPIQLFARQDRYALVAVDDPSGYWEQPHVGRAMARLDFDRDGQDDLAITHLNEPVALLINQTPTENHWLRLSLVGTHSSRLPVGAVIVVHADRDWYHFVTAGDGYLCRNEPCLTIGLGSHSDPVSLTVLWPDRTRQRVDGLSVDTDWLLVQDHDAYEYVR
ncbi:FG-GAP-like repeat-containing protein [Stieleria sp. TO1_6]|uniref:FG-GAP-like repeat-containing protein n=1 Tax=Stieleria tagensis TaxID=2956795 RepID=UPI00209B8BD7|nr:FG-GAP-like repeat-containing protein [Stieleria tagensis]MCO8120189.1 FG-GAP-like repeat-containing protein [Stieleria tagensis]